MVQKHIRSLPTPFSCSRPKKNLHLLAKFKHVRFLGPYSRYICYAKLFGSCLEKLLKRPGIEI
jgi:hypothetical protein